MVKIPDFAQVGLQLGGMQAYNDAAIRPPDVDAGREAQQLGRAMEQVGRGLGDYASALLTQARVEQNELNRSYAVEAFVNYRSKVDKDLYDPQAGYFTKGGRAAFEGERDAVFGRMRQYLDDVEKTLPNQSAKDLFRNRALLYAEERGLQVDLHAGKERKVYQNAVDEQLLQAEQADVPMLWKDADMQTFVRDPNAPKTEFQLRLEAFQKAIRDVGTRRGSAPEIIEANVEAATTAVYAQVVDREADPAKALKLFDQFVAEKKIVAQDPQKARSGLQARVTEKAGQELGSQTWFQFGEDYGLASASLNEQLRSQAIDTPTFNKAMSQVDSMHRQKATAFASRGLSALQQARKWIDDPANSKAQPGDMPQDMLTELRDTDMLDSAVAYMANGRRFLNNSATLADYAKLSASNELGLLSEQQVEARFRGGTDDAMFQVIVRDWQRQSNVAASQQPTPGRSGGASNTPTAVPEYIEAELLKRMGTAPGTISVTDAGKPDGIDSISRWAWFRKEFGQRYAAAMQIAEKQKDPLAAAEEIYNDMVQAWSPSANKYLWEMMPSERAAAKVEMQVTYSEDKQELNLQQVSAEERQQAAMALQAQGYTWQTLSDSQILRHAIQRRENMSAQRKQERLEAGNRWVSWYTVEQQLGFTREKLEQAAISDPNTSPVHPSDFVYETVGEAAYSWNPITWIPGYTGQRFDADLYATLPASERSNHAGISRSAFNRLLAIKRGSSATWEDVRDSRIVAQPTLQEDRSMTFGEARQFAAHLSKPPQDRTALLTPLSPSVIENRKQAAIMAYELEFPELAYIGKRLGKLYGATIRQSEPQAPDDVVQEYNRLTGMNLPRRYY